MTTILRHAVILTIVGLAAAAPARASDRCTSEPRSSWMSLEAVRERATGLGYTVQKVKEEDGCFEVYGRDAQGARYELYFHPVSGELVRRKAD